MTKEVRMTKSEPTVVRHLNFGILSDFDISHSSFLQPSVHEQTCDAEKNRQCPHRAEDVRHSHAVDEYVTRYENTRDAANGAGGYDKPADFADVSHVLGDEPDHVGRKRREAE